MLYRAYSTGVFDAYDIYQATVVFRTASFVITSHYSVKSEFSRYCEGEVYLHKKGSIGK